MSKTFLMVLSRKLYPIIELSTASYAEASRLWAGSTGFAADYPACDVWAAKTLEWSGERSGRQPCCPVTDLGRSLFIPALCNFYRAPECFLCRFSLTLTQQPLAKASQYNRKKQPW